MLVAQISAISTQILVFPLKILEPLFEVLGLLYLEHLILNSFYLVVFK